MMGRHYDALTNEQRAQVDRIVREQREQVGKMRIFRYHQPVDAEATTDGGDTVYQITSMEER